MIPVLRVETLKLARSPVGVIATAVLVVGIVAICAGMMTALRSGDPQVIAKLGAAASLDWTGLLSGSAQIIGTGGLLGFGIVAAWVFGREFADGTVAGLFALPAGRGTIAAAKLIVFVAWALVVSVAIGVALLLTGLLLGFGIPDGAAATALLRQVGLGAFNAALAMTAAWVATAARSLLAGVATAIGLVVLAPVGVLAGAGGWMPVAAPALWAISGGAAVSPTQLITAGLLAGLAGAATVWWWHRLQLDR
ncbi:MAG: ABC transporter permease [Dermatophilaceae bacterium]